MNSGHGTVTMTTTRVVGGEEIEGDLEIEFTFTEECGSGAYDAYGVPLEPPGGFEIELGNAFFDGEPAVLTAHEEDAAHAKAEEYAVNA